MENPYNSHSPYRAQNVIEANFRSWLQYIADITCDRDGYKSAKDLGELVDEVREMALSALRGETAPIPEDAVNISPVMMDILRLQEQVAKQKSLVKRLEMALYKQVLKGLDSDPDKKKELWDHWLNNLEHTNSEKED